MTVSINGTTGITYPDFTVQPWSLSDLNYFYGRGHQPTPRLSSMKFTGGSGGGVSVPINPFIMETRPQRIQSTLKASNLTSSDDVITVPAETTPNDTVLVGILYELDTVTRPTIPNFTIIESFNGTLAGAASTRILHVGKITPGQTEIVIPNNAATGGHASVAVRLFGEQTISSVSFFTVPASGSVPVVRPAAINPREIDVLIQLGDFLPADVIVDWPSAPQWDYFNTRTLTGGRAGIIHAAYETNTTSPINALGVVGGASWCWSIVAFRELT